MKKVIKISREQILNTFYDTDGFDLETLIEMVKKQLYDHFKEYTNEELLEELEQRGDLEPGEYNPFDIEEDFDEIIIE